MLITEFSGRIVIAQPGASSIDPTPVLRLENIIKEDATAGGERELVNVIADPVDEFRIFSRALSATEVQSIINNPVVAP